MAMTRDFYERSIERCDGNFRRIAHELDVSLRHLYRDVERLKLWPEINRARLVRLEDRSDKARRTLDSPTARARAVLKGTER